MCDSILTHSQCRVVIIEAVLAHYFRIGPFTITVDAIQNGGAVIVCFNPRITNPDHEQLAAWKRDQVRFSVGIDAALVIAIVVSYGKGRGEI